ncbi:MAG: T9SS type A sorting domain-containing protein, partial [Bacteroidia bacterium]
PGGSSVPGGIPYTQIPTGLTGHYKCGVPLGDSAIVLAIFKKSGAVIGQYIQFLYGTHSSYTTFHMPITGLPFAPDTVVIGAASSNPFSSIPNFNGLPGSYLQLDSLSFTGVASQPALMNGDFENWSTATYYSPDYWQTQGDSVTRSTVAHNGIYSLELQVTTNQGGGSSGGNADQATTGHYTPHSGPAGGRPYVIQNDSLIGYYKFASLANDTAYINVNTSHLGSSVGGGFKQLLGNSAYQRFAIAVNSSVVPDSVRIDIQAANYPVRPATIGSKLYIDQLYFLSAPLGIPLLIMSNDKVNVYPNPGKGLFNLIYDSNSDEPVSLEIYNSVGQKLFTKQLNGQAEMRTQVDISSYGKGIYFMKAIQGSHVSSTKMIVE